MCVSVLVRACVVQLVEDTGRSLVDSWSHSVDEFDGVPHLRDGDSIGKPESTLKNVDPNGDLY